jgi:hypothetical protein
MRAHILTVTFEGVSERIPPHLCGRAAVLLRETYPESSTTRGWIDAGARTVLGRGDVVVLEIICPNAVSSDSVIAAVNKAVRSEMPELTNDQWETLLFSSVPCANQDR